MEVDPFWHKYHDYFNLIVIPVILALNIYLFLEYNPTNLAIYIHGFIIYMVADTLWLIIRPRSVASPATGSLQSGN